MLCVLVNEDVDCINLEGNLRNVLYKDKPLNNLLHFDTVNVLTHYVDELDKFQKKGNSLNSYRITQPSDIVVKEYPALQALASEWEQAYPAAVDGAFACRARGAA